MQDIIKVKAHIKLLPDNLGRKTPFLSGYRPVFWFKSASTRISGKIELIDSSSFKPNAEGDVFIFFNKGIIDTNNFRENEKFEFTEGLNPIGKGEILQVLVS